ncbi:hypothetical protein [Macrococcus equipercicus]|uniref:Uncharacterized protein n=1 Tax=Macrococcus equipercicus TaxID=69967 RepID=A0A9Q9BV15_9STAP|nr:hypothetical protein [Macrococcus equipercicus]KAA1039331.1 hypothetical protein ERX35_007095 [Macrococcus equipercicus]UTH13622.1 hypothetical protein KFV11_10425 [Macrococcus equipercicus]
MKLLTILDYSNIVALLLSTVLVLGLKFAGWDSLAISALMILMLLLVVVNRFKNKKYRAAALPVVVTARDRLFGYASIAIMVLLFVIVLLFPGLR